MLHTLSGSTRAQSIEALLLMLVVTGPLPMSSAVGAQDGVLDTTFGADGMLGIPMGSSDASGYGLLVQPDGKYLLAGVAGNATEDFGVVRVNPTSSLDGTFGSVGRAFWDSGWGHDGGWDVALQSDGSVVVVGVSRLDGSNQLTALRFTSEGDPDTSFGPSSLGYSIIDFGGNSWGNAVVLQPDGKIVVAGGTDARSLFAVARLTTGGTPDPQFGTNGIFAPLLEPIGVEEATDVALQSDGKIVVVGTIADSFAVARLDTEGTLDSSFGLYGYSVFDFGGPSNARAVAVQLDDKIVVVGSTTVDSSIAVARLDRDGALDPSFGSTGLVTKAIGWGPDEGWDVALQADGKIVVAGSIRIDALTECALFRLNSDGSFDEFGPTVAGPPTYVTFHLAGSSHARGVAIQSDGKIVVVGDGTAANGTILFLLARLHNKDPFIFADAFETGGTGAWTITVP